MSVVEEFLYLMKAKYGDERVSLVDSIALPVTVMQWCKACPTAFATTTGALWCGPCGEKRAALEAGPGISVKK